MKGKFKWGKFLVFSADLGTDLMSIGFVAFLFYGLYQNWWECNIELISPTNTAIFGGYLILNTAGNLYKWGRIQAKKIR